MSPRSFGSTVLRTVEPLDADELVEPAVVKVRESGLPALPVTDRGRFHGIFGEREFIAALFPGYVGELGSASFVPRAMEDVIDRRLGCRAEPIRKHVTTDHVEVQGDYSDVQLAEIFLHHRVLIVPVLDDKTVTGVITRSEFFTALAEHFVSSS